MIDTIPSFRILLRLDTDDFQQKDTCEHGCLESRFPMFEELLKTSKSMLQGVDTYLTFEENRMSRAAVTRLYVPRKSDAAGSITFIHGPAGVGKSHLVSKTLHDLNERYPETRFLIATANALFEALQRADDAMELAEILDKFRTLDIVVCEDLHWLESFPAAQPQLMMLVEELETGPTQFLFTSRKPVGEIRELDQRLVSRCHGGLCVAMTLPGPESRSLLFQHWFREYRLPIMKPFVDSARFLAEKLPLAPRELRQVTADLAASKARRAYPIDVTYLERWLSKSDHAPRLSLDAIVLHVAEEFGVEAEQIRSRSRQQGLAVPRQCAMWLARELMGQPLEQIGRYFERSHATVSHSLSRLQDLLPHAPTLRQQVQKLRQKLDELPREECA